MQGMNSGRQTMAHRVNKGARQKIFPPEVLNLSQAELKRRLGFRPATARRKTQTWLLYDNEYINSDDYVGEHTKKTIFRGDIMFRVSTFPSACIRLMTRSIIDCGRYTLRDERDRCFDRRPSLPSVHKEGQRSLVACANNHAWAPCNLRRTGA
jgi:hypothetical protein